MIDLSDPNLVPAIYQNLCDSIWSLREHWKQAVFEQNEKQRRWYSPIPFAFVFNTAISTHPPDGDEKNLIQDTIAFFKNRQRKEFDWWLAPGLETSDWPRQLMASGLAVQDEPPGMALALNRLPLAVAVPSGVQIRRVEDEATIKIWNKTFIEGYGLPPDWEPACCDMMLASLPGGSMVSYLATIDGLPVATSGVFYSAGVACIINVSTLNAWRGKGLGAAVTLKPLQDARSAGYQVGVLQASDLGYPVYLRLGFKEVCRMVHYHWQDAEPPAHPA